MHINSVQFQEDGSFRLTTENKVLQEDGSFIVTINKPMSVADSMENTERIAIQKWLDEGNTPDPFDPYPGKNIGQVKALRIREIRLKARMLATKHITPHIIDFLDPEEKIDVPASVRTYQRQLASTISSSALSINTFSNRMDIFNFLPTFPPVPDA